MREVGGWVFGLRGGKGGSLRKASEDLPATLEKLSLRFD